MNLPTIMPRLLCGMEPDKFSTNVLNINGDGIWADGNGQNIFQYSQSQQGLLQIDLTRMGLGGRDTGIAPSTLSPWYLYFFGDPANRSITSAVLSQSETYGGVSMANVPANYTSMRKAPFGFIYNPNWDGIPNFHIPANYGLITFTDSQYGSPWVALSQGQSSTWVTLDLSGYIPDNARMAYIKTEVRDARQSIAGSGYVRSYVAQTVGDFCGSTSPTSPSIVCNHFLRVDSSRHIQWMTAGGSNISVTMLGYLMTEPS